MEIEETTANEIWKTIHDEDLFTRLIPITDMHERVEWVLKNHYEDMIHEAPMTTQLVKNELVKKFKEKAISNNMQNPFDKIEEPDVMPNPGFMCQQYIETNSHIKKYWPKDLCVKQCDECLNKVIEHHKRKLIDHG